MIGHIGAALKTGLCGGEHVFFVCAFLPEVVEA